MAYKSFLSPTGSGNTVFEGDVLNGYVSAKKEVVLKFYANDRGYACASFGRSENVGEVLKAEGVKALQDELKTLLESHGASAGVFNVTTPQKHYSLRREYEGAELVLGIHGTDPRFGTAFHRGSLDELKKLLAEFDAVLKTISEGAVLS